MVHYYIFCCKITMATSPTTPNELVNLIIDELRHSLEPKMARALANYQLYKETHDAVLQIPFVKHLLETQCKCHATQSTQSQLVDPIQLEIIDVANEQCVPNLDSIAEYLNESAIQHGNHAFNTDEESEETEQEEEEQEEQEEQEEEQEEQEEQDEQEEQEEQEQDEQEQEQEEEQEEQ